MEMGWRKHNDPVHSSDTILTCVFPLSSLTLASTLPQPKPVRAVKTPFHHFLTLPEAEALDGGGDVDHIPRKGTPPIPLW